MCVFEYYFTYILTAEVHIINRGLKKNCLWALLQYKATLLK